MADTPKKKPLWVAMHDAALETPLNHDSLARDTADQEASRLLVLADWLVPEEPKPQGIGFSSGSDWVWRDRQRLRSLLLAEADRARRGDG